MPVPLPSVQAVLDLMLIRGGIDPTLTISDLRTFCDEGVVMLHQYVRPASVPLTVTDHVVLSAAGHVPVRIYLPEGTSTRAVHVHLHGGGWWMGSVETADPMARELAAHSGLAVVSVDYRLSPEHPFPAGLEDVLAVLRWLGSAPHALGFEVGSISLGGESAGANLAAAAALTIRDHGGPVLAGLWLDVPALDLTTPMTESLSAYGTGFGLEVALFPLMMTWYLGGPAPNRNATDPLVSPALATDLSNLPPTLVTTAELDPIRDQGEKFAIALGAAGNEVISNRHQGHVHASSWLTGLAGYDANWYATNVRHLISLHDRVAAMQR